jgi:hypothetical protein
LLVNRTDGRPLDDDGDRSIATVIMSLADVHKLFVLVSDNDNRWVSPPVHWHRSSSPLKLGGVLTNKRLELTSHLQEIPVHLPNVFGLIRGSDDNERFVMIGYRVNNKQQAQVIDEMIRAFGQVKQHGWRPRCVSRAFDDTTRTRQRTCPCDAFVVSVACRCSRNERHNRLLRTMSFI